MSQLYSRTSFGVGYAERWNVNRIAEQFAFQLIGRSFDYQFASINDGQSTGQLVGLFQIV